MPGDLLIIEQGMIVPCDAILLHGSCTMNESILTGESIPIIKSSLPKAHTFYDPLDENKQNTILSGTLCIESRSTNHNHKLVVSIVSQTSFNTMKG